MLFRYQDEVRYTIFSAYISFRNSSGPHLVIFISFYSCSMFDRTSIINFCLGNWGYRPFVTEFLDQIGVEVSRRTLCLICEEEGRFSLFKPGLLLRHCPFLTRPFFRKSRKYLGMRVKWCGAAHNLKYHCLSPILKCLCHASKVCLFLSPTICLTDVAVSFIHSSSSFSYLYTSLDQYLTRPSSQPWPRAPALSPLPTLRSTQQNTINNPQHFTAHNRTFIPVYVYLEHLAAIQQFLLSLGQPLVLDPALAYPCQAPTFCWPLALPVRHITPIYLLHLVSPPPQLLAIHPWHLFQSIQFLPCRIRPPQARKNTTLLLLERRLACSGMNGNNFNSYFNTWLANSMSCKDNIEPLVKRVSGSHYKSFLTHEQVLAYYSDTKNNGWVEVIRNPGDDEIYGPRSEVEQ